MVFETVADGQHDIRFDPLKDRRQFDQTEPCRFGHSRGSLAFHEHKNFCSRFKTIVPDEIDHRAVAVEQRRSTSYQL